MPANSHQIQRTIKQLGVNTRNRAYEFGMRYYYHPDWFFDLGEPCSRHRPETNHVNDNSANGTVNQDPELFELRRVLKKRLKEQTLGIGGRNGEFVNFWSAALRLSASQALGLEDHEDAEILRKTQQSDGSWTKDSWIHNYGKRVLLGNAGSAPWL